MLALEMESCVTDIVIYFCRSSKIHNHSYSPLCASLPIITKLLITQLLPYQLCNVVLVDSLLVHYHCIITNSTNSTK